MATWCAVAGRRVAELRAEDFALPSAELTETLRGVTKELFDCAKQHDAHGLSVLGELYVANFDLEQIWEQLQLHNGPLVRQLEKSVRQLLARTDEIELAPREEAREDVRGNAKPGPLRAGARPGGSDDKADADCESAADADSAPTRRKGARKRSAAPRRPRSAASVDELLDEMDSFVELAERQQLRGGDGGGGDNGGDDDDDDGDEDEDDGDVEGDGDVFGAGVDGSDDERTEELDGEEAQEEDDEDEGGDRETDDDDDDDDGDGDEADAGVAPGAHRRAGRTASARAAARALEVDDGDEDDEGGEGEAAGRAPRSLSAHELRLARMQEKVAALEEANVGAKPWQLRGEVGATARPLNSLLEEHVDFEAAARPAPAVTQEVTVGIEDAIKARILQGLFDDVERRAPPDARKLRPPSAELSQERNALGLAAQYEQQFRQQAMGQDRASDKTDARRAEISRLLASLCAQLDALTNFHFAPPPPSAGDAEVRPNLPALRLEERTPAALSLASGLAAAEVKAPQHTRALPAAAELGRSERKAKRNAHKHHAAREKRRRIGKERETPAGTAAQLGKELAAAKRSKTARVTAAEPARADGKARPSFTRSAQLFGKLQREGAERPRRTTAAERAASASAAGVAGASFKL